MLPRLVRSGGGRIIDVEQVLRRHLRKTEKSRLDMARKRAELKLRSPAEQQAAAAKAREHRAKYRERNRENLRSKEAQRRARIYDNRVEMFRSRGESQETVAWSRVGGSFESSRSGSDLESGGSSDISFDQDEEVI